ncbi:MAG: guanylate kinase [Syntrophales bacterium]|nr:guanylate kinase [Syntrophales bacterium]
MEGKSSLYIVVSAPSGTGKTTMCSELLKSCPNLVFSVSYTTRPKRPGEIEGRDYHFVSKEEFLAKLERGDFLEWAENFGYLYGTDEVAIKEALLQGKDVLVDVDHRGAKILKERLPGGVFVFILPPSFEELYKRLARRGCEARETLESRFARARDEIKEVFWYDYIIVNDDLSEAVRKLRAIYLAEKCRRDRMMRFVEELWENEFINNGRFYGKNNN